MKEVFQLWLTDNTLLPGVFGCGVRFPDFSCLSQSHTEMLTAERLDQVHGVHTSGDEVVARALDGSAAVSPVAVALAEAGIQVRSLTLRTPTLDDVFLELTGNRIEERAA